MGRIHGITVTLYERTQSGEDGFGKPVYTETPVDVENVLPGLPSAEEITDTLNLTGKRLAYTLGIPKGDSHTWTDRKVCFFNGTFRTFGPVEEGVEDLVPLEWHRKVKVERIE